LAKNYRSLRKRIEKASHLKNATGRKHDYKRPDKSKGGGR